MTRASRVQIDLYQGVSVTWISDGVTQLYDSHLLTTCVDIAACAATEKIKKIELPGCEIVDKRNKCWQVCGVSSPRDSGKSLRLEFADPANSEGFCNDGENWWMANEYDWNTTLEMRLTNNSLKIHPHAVPKLRQSRISENNGNRTFTISVLTHIRYDMKKQPCCMMIREIHGNDANNNFGLYKLNQLYFFALGRKCNILPDGLYDNWYFMILIGTSLDNFRFVFAQFWTDFVHIWNTHSWTYATQKKQLCWKQKLKCSTQLC